MGFISFPTSTSQLSSQLTKLAGLEKQYTNYKSVFTTKKQATTSYIGGMSSSSVPTNPTSYLSSIDSVANANMNKVTNISSIPDGVPTGCLSAIKSAISSVINNAMSTVGAIVGPIANVVGQELGLLMSYLSDLLGFGSNGALSKLLSEIDALLNCASNDPDAPLDELENLMDDINDFVDENCFDDEGNFDTDGITDQVTDSATDFSEEKLSSLKQLASKMQTTAENAASQAKTAAETATENSKPKHITSKVPAKFF